MRSSPLLIAIALLSCGVDQRAALPPGEYETPPGVVPIPAPPTGNSGGEGGALVGEPMLPDDPPEEPLDCFFQKSQGLWWEIKSEIPGHLRESNGTYSWFMPEHGRRLEGVADKGECTAIECDTQSYIDAVNALFLCGESDWRLPTGSELLHRPQLGNSSDDFPDDENFYWSSDLNPDDPDVAQAVYLCCGGIETPAVKTGAGRVLLVREGGPPG